jgi:hypothetical protein
LQVVRPVVRQLVSLAQLVRQNQLLQQKRAELLRQQQLLHLLQQRALLLQQQHRVPSSPVHGFTLQPQPAVSSPPLLNFFGMGNAGQVNRAVSLATMSAGNARSIATRLAFGG